MKLEMKLCWEKAASLDDRLLKVDIYKGSSCKDNRLSPSQLRLALSLESHPLSRPDLPTAELAEISTPW